MIFRNHYNYIPVLIQQQGQDTIGLDAYKANRIQPTLSGLSDSKNPGKDSTLMLGITNPFSFEIPEYYHYNIAKMKGYARFIQVVLNREGESNGMLATYFDGATNYFAPLPKFNDIQALNKVYQLVQRNMDSAHK